MKRLIVVVLALISAGAAAIAQPPSPSTNLWYTRPAEIWTDALPAGNGRLGAMVFGGAAHERIQFKWDPLESTCRHASLSIL